MTKAQLLASADSLELTKWIVFFKVRADHEKRAVEDAEFERRVTSGG